MKPPCAGDVRLVGRGRVGGRRPRIRLHGSLAVVDGLEQLPERLRERRRLLGQPAQLVELLARLAHGAAADDRRLAERRERRAAALRERRQAGQEGVEPGRGGAQVAQHGLLGGGELAQPQHVRDRARPGSAGAGRTRPPARRCAWPPPPRCRPPRGRSATRPPGAGRARRRRCPRAATTRSMVRVWRASIRSVWVVSRSPGCARRSAALRSSGRPASPAPSSPMMSRRRSAYGRRTMLFTRSSGIVEVVWATGTRPPSGIRSPELPGWQSTKYSPMNDCGRISQCASRRRSAKPGSVIFDLHDARAGAARRLRPRGRSSCPPARRRP